MTTADLVPSDSTFYYEVSDANLMDHVEVQRVAETLSEVSAKVLDIGCGTGTFGAMLDAGCDYTGVDLHVAEDRRTDLRCGNSMREFDTVDGSLCRVSIRGWFFGRGHQLLVSGAPASTGSDACGSDSCIETGRRNISHVSQL